MRSTFLTKQLTTRVYRGVQYNTKDAMLFHQDESSHPASMLTRRLLSLSSYIPSFSDDFPVPLNRASGFFVSQGLEATLSDSKKKYSDKVSALLSAWEHVTNFIPAASSEAIQSLIEWAHRWVHVVRRSSLSVRDYVADPRLTRNSFREDTYGRGDNTVA